MVVSSSAVVVVVDFFAAMGDMCRALGGVRLRAGGSRKRLRPDGVSARAPVFGVVDLDCLLLLLGVLDDFRVDPLDGGLGSERGRDAERNEERAGGVSRSCTDLLGVLLGVLRATEAGVGVFVTTVFATGGAVSRDAGGGAAGGGGIEVFSWLSLLFLPLKSS